MSARKKKPVIQLPKIIGPKSGLVKKGRIWHMIYYEDGALRTTSTGETTLKRAVFMRTMFHENRVHAGATYKGGTSAKPSVLAAKKNPEGMDCIYKQTTYKVVVAGKHVITTTDFKKARDKRNEYINRHF